MGMKEWAERESAKAAATGSFAGIALVPDTITHKGVRHSTKGATARVEQGADIRRRITATRLAALGPFALAARKPVGHIFLTIEGPDYQLLVEVDAKKEADARKFAAKVNTAGMR